MSTMKDAKKNYDRIPIPKELNERVQKAIEQSAAHPDTSRHFLPFCRTAAFKYAACAASLIIVFTAVLNTSVAFATELQQLPVLGTIAKVLTFRSYETKEDGIKVSVDIPKIELASDTVGLSDMVNREILALCEQYLSEANNRAAEYKKAFLETGGTEEEWAAHDLGIDVGYNIKTLSDDYLSFSVYCTENWASAYNETHYYNMDLKTGQFISLKDILGENYVELANESIHKQIEERTKEQGDIFFPAESGGFTGISDETNFYIDEAGNPVVVFAKYEIAIGAAGTQEFEILK